MRSQSSGLEIKQLETHKTSALKLYSLLKLSSLLLFFQPSSQKCFLSNTSTTVHHPPSSWTHFKVQTSYTVSTE